MRAGTRLIRRLLDHETPHVHAYRREAVSCAVASALAGARITIASLGRELGGGSERYGIKRIDRLCDNPRLAAEVDTLQGVVCRTMIGSSKRPLVSVDWSHLAADGSRQMLAASLALERRGLTIFARAYEERQVNQLATHRHFLERLRAQLPKGCRPIIVADAGFHGSFCELVRSLGWDFVVRIRNNPYVQKAGTKQWVHGKSLHELATSEPQHLGTYLVARSAPQPGQLVLARQPRRHRKHRKLNGEASRATNSRKHARAASEPWLLTTSLKNVKAKQAVKIYGRRMSIEESFRDTKNTRLGRGLSASLCRDVAKINVLLTIDVLAGLGLWLLGMAADLAGLTPQLQANSVRSRRVLSFPFVGGRIARALKRYAAKLDLQAALMALEAAVYRLAEAF